MPEFFDEPTSVPDPELYRATVLERARRWRRSRRLVAGGVVFVLAAGSATGAAVALTRSSGPTGLQSLTTVSPSPVAFPTLQQPGQACPATPGSPVNNAYFDGVELGAGPVKMLVANAGNLARGIVYIVPADKNNPLGPRRFYAFQNFWYSLPSYTGAWTVTAQRLDGSGSVRFGDSYPTRTAHPVPAGGAQEFGHGYRSGIGSTWVDRPGCYGFRVSGPRLSEVVVVDVVLR
jgi:hypothetical protein